MKKFKEFKSEQQYIKEIGPIAATLMGAMALWGGFQAFKKVKSKIKGYKKSKSEKAQNKKTGLVVDLKVFNSETGETDTIPKVIEPGSKEANIDDDGVGKLEKKMQAAQNVKNMAARVKWEKEGGKKEEPPASDDAPEGGGEEEPITDPKAAADYYNKNGESPDGWKFMLDPQGDVENPRSKEKGKMVSHDEYKKILKQRSAERKGGKSIKDQELAHTILKFGEFIAEDIMKDLKKASKSKKDTEITLDDGTDIPIDPITADIFVKYIEGLSSSEKNKTIKQIQRTERGFMKVLGKAHEG
jgi:hypothetical protein